MEIKAINRKYQGLVNRAIKEMKKYEKGKLNNSINT